MDESDGEVTPAVEQQLGRAVSQGLPLAGVAAAVVVGVLSGLGPALLVLAGAALLGVVALVWASVRMLTGEAPVPDELADTTWEATSAAHERKNTLVRALKDLEHEHAVGKIDDHDYAELAREYRDQIKTLMRAMDMQIDPLRERAEALARRHLEAKGLDGGAPAPSGRAQALSVRRPCAQCHTSNDPDAAFCKACGSKLAAEPADAHG